jgi:hypothetical protein
MNRLQEVIDHLVKHDTLVFMYGGKQTLFAMYGMSKLSIGEPVLIIDNTVFDIIQHTKNIDYSYNHFKVPRSNSFV